MVVNELVRMCLPEADPTNFDPPYNPKWCEIPQGNKIALALLSTVQRAHHRQAEARAIWRAVPSAVERQQEAE
eukprot:8705976-Lingulodinium_polyedra.AAC.1